MVETQQKEQQRIEKLKEIKHRFLRELQQANLNSEDWEDVKMLMDRIIPNDWR